MFPDACFNVISFVVPALLYLYASSKSLRLFLFVQLSSFKVFLSKILKNTDARMSTLIKDYVFTMVAFVKTMRHNLKSYVLEKNINKRYIFSEFHCILREEGVGGGLGAS